MLPSSTNDFWQNRTTAFFRCTRVVTKNDYLQYVFPHLLQAYLPVHSFKLQTRFANESCSALRNISELSEP